MPQQPTKRKRRPGQGRPAELDRPRRANFYIESADLDALALLEGEVSAHVRAAIKAYLAREDIAAQLRETRELIAEGDE